MISEKLKAEIAVISIVHIVAIVLALVFFMVIYIKARRDYAVKAFLVMQASTIFWMIFKIFKTVSPTETLRWAFIVAYYFCICLFEVTFFEFSFSYYKGRPLKKAFRYGLYSLATIQFLWVLTNPWHHLFYATYNFWTDSFGVLFYVHSVIAYGLLLAGVVYCGLTFRRRFVDVALWYKVALAVAMLFPLIFNYLFIAGKIEQLLHLFGIAFTFDTDITPIIFVLSTSIFLYATFNHQLLDLSPIMKHEIVHKLDTAICVVDDQGKVVYVNQKMLQSFGSSAKSGIAQLIKRLKIDDMVDKSSDILVDNRVYDVFVQRVDVLLSKQYIMRFNNISDYKKVEADILLEQRALSETNQALQGVIEELKKVSKIGARNYVARELHDIIGHSLVVAIKALEVAKLYRQIDPSASQKAIDDSARALQMGVQLMGDVNTDKARLYGAALQRDIEDILRRIASSKIKTRLNFRGAHQLVDGAVYDAISRICLELVTNSLKHAAASEIFISVTLRPATIDLLYIDDGVGCANLEAGNGLRGIKKRLSEINGMVKFVSPPGEGFSASIKIRK